MLPHGLVTILDETADALVYSGSEITCINEDFLQSLRANFIIPTLPITSTYVQGATGTKAVRVKEPVFLPFTVGGVSGCENVFLAVKVLIRQMIFGTDWLTSVNASISFAPFSFALYWRLTSRNCLPCGCIRCYTKENSSSHKACKSLFLELYRQVSDCYSNCETTV